MSINVLLRAQHIVVDVKSSLGRLDMPGVPPEANMECVACFRFQVTWNYLKGPRRDSPKVPWQRPEATPSTVAPSPAVSLAPAQTPRSAGPVVLEPFALSGQSLGREGPAQWEMVVPKMVRPAATPTAIRIAASPPASPTPVPVADQGVADLASTVTIEKAVIHAIPSSLMARPQDSFLARFWRQILVMAFAIAAIVFVLRGRAVKDATPSTPEIASLTGWGRQSLLPPGRSLSIYEPSRSESDYRIEFQWVPDPQGAGWVFRMRGPGDYLAARLSLVQPGVNLILAAEHFTVSGGIESVHSRKEVPLINTQGLVHVRMDIVGPAFTLFLQDIPVDYWTDARLTSGGAGFYDEQEQRPQLQMLRFTFLKPGLAHTAVASQP